MEVIELSGDSDLSDDERRSTSPEPKRRRGPTNHPQSQSIVSAVPSWVSRFFKKRSGVRVLPDACIFCFKKTEDRGELFGKVSRISDSLGPNQDCTVSAHDLCMFFASDLSQSGDPKGPMLGFSCQDIKKEFSRASRLTCYVCHKAGASVGCCVPDCKRSYHLPCARQNKALLEFCDNYSVWCPNHWVDVHEMFQRKFVPQSPPKEKTTCRMTLGPGDYQPPATCILCSDKVPSKHKVRCVVRTTCCRRGATCDSFSKFYHFGCIQELALRKGSETLKCPFCSSEETFQEMLQLQFIYIPDGDIPEEEDAGSERLGCWFGAECGRETAEAGGRLRFDEASETEFIDWELLNPCKTCGGVVHRKCAGGVWADENFDGEEPEWACPGCS